MRPRSFSGCLLLHTEGKDILHSLAPPSQWLANLPLLACILHTPTFFGPITSMEKASLSQAQTRCLIAFLVAFALSTYISTQSSNQPGKRHIIDQFRIRPLSQAVGSGLESSEYLGEAGSCIRALVSNYPASIMQNGMERKKLRPRADQLPNFR